METGHSIEGLDVKYFKYTPHSSTDKPSADKAAAEAGGAEPAEASIDAAPVMGKGKSIVGIRALPGAVINDKGALKQAEFAALFS